MDPSSPEEVRRMRGGSVSRDWSGIGSRSSDADVHILSNRVVMD